MDVQMDERRFDLKESIARQMRMGGKPNPLIDHFNNDRVVMELRQDIHDRFDKTKYQACAGCAPLLVLPCFWPHLCIFAAMGTVCGVPCDYCFCAEDRLKKIGAAHKLVLRERSIHYIVETHMQTSLVQPICFSACGNCGQTIDRFEEVYPISMVSWAGVVPAVKVCGGAGPDTFIAKLNESTFPSVAIDAPANGTEFADALEKQKALIKDATGGVPGADLPPALLQEFQQYLMSSSAFGGGAMLGAMMMQQQAAAGGNAQNAMLMGAMMTPQTNMLMQRNNNMTAAGMVPTAAPVPMAAEQIAVAVDVDDAQQSVSPKLQGFSVEDVAASLNTLNLGQYVQRFREEGIDGRALGDLDERTLETDLGIGSGLHRKKILRWIREGH